MVIETMKKSYSHVSDFSHGVSYSVYFLVFKNCYLKSKIC